MSKRYHILFEPIDECALPVVCIDADGALSIDGQNIDEFNEKDVPAVFYQGYPHQVQAYLGRITEPDKVVAWWITEVGEEVAEHPTYHVLLKPMGGCALPVISIEAERGAADNHGRLDALKDIPSLFWRDYRRGNLSGRILRPGDVLAWWRTIPSE